MGSQKEEVEETSAPDGTDGDVSAASMTRLLYSCSQVKGSADSREKEQEIASKQVRTEKKKPDQKCRPEVKCRPGQPEQEVSYQPKVKTGPASAREFCEATCVF